MELLAGINLIGIIYLFFVVQDLKKRLPTQPQTQPLSSRHQNISDTEAVPVYQPVVANTTEEPDFLQRFFSWFARDWPLKVGALFILLGFVWLVSYAFLNDWIGPVGRIILGIITGSAILVWGSQRIKINVYQGEILTALGSGVILVSIFAAQYVYSKMFSPTIALVLVTLVTVTVAFISYRNNTIRLAILGFLIGAIAPMLTASDTPGVLGLFSYLFCLTAATVWLVRLTGWRLLLLISIFVIWVYSVPFLNLYIAPSNLVYMRFFAVTFSIMFYLLSLSAFTYDRSTKAEDALIGGLIGLYSLHWILTIFPVDYRSILCVGLAIGFMYGSLVIFKLHKIEYPVYIYTGVSIIFLVVATIIQFKGTVVPIALAVEALVLLIFADTMYSPRMVKWIAFLFILPLFYSLEYLIGYSASREDGVLILINLIFYGGAVYLMQYAKQQDDVIKQIAKVFMVASGIYSLIYLWISMPYYFGYGEYIQSSSAYSSYGYPDNSRLLLAHAVTLIIYAAIGIAMYIFGMRENRKLTKNFGFWLTCFVIARLLLIEVWNMELAPRIITFFIVGIILMASVFIRKSHEKKS